MFRCAITGNVTKPGEPMTKVVVETRPTTYVNYKWDEEADEKVRIDSKGFETVKEIAVSQEGLKQIENYKVAEVGARIREKRQTLMRRLADG